MNRPALSEPAEPGSIRIDWTVAGGDWPCRRTLEHLVQEIGAAVVPVIGPLCRSDSEAGLVFSDDAHLRELNRQFRNIGKPTNVLAFPATPGESAPFGPLLGDVVLAHKTVALEAEVAGIPFDHHLKHLIIHGLLHLVGHDHRSRRQAEEMERLEARVLSTMNIDDPYRIPAAGMSHPQGSTR